MSASVKIMLSYDYCHFEICKGTDQEITNKEINELRKDCQRLADESVRQYQVAKEHVQRLNSYEKKEFDATIEMILKKDESALTIQEKAMLKHGDAKSGKKTPEYITWESMKRRCYCKGQKGYRNYGGRGIVVCERWLNSFPNFLEDMGRKPSSKHSLERVNNWGIYKPSNCKWATDKEQSRNTRRNRLITYKNKTMILSDWADEFNVSAKNLRGYLEHRNIEEIEKRIKKGYYEKLHKH